MATAGYLSDLGDGQVDALPLLDVRWNDTDDDSWGDNALQTRGDACIHAPGGGGQDRSGCPDSDGDGDSDPGANGSASPGGDADAFVNDPTQWADSDTLRRVGGTWCLPSPLRIAISGWSWIPPSIIRCTWVSCRSTVCQPSIGTIMSSFSVIGHIP